MLGAHHPLSRRLLCRFTLVVLQQAPQSFSTPHCSHVPPCLRPRRKQDPIAFALMVALLVVMYDVLLQRSPQGRFSKQDQPRQTFFFDRPHPALRVCVQIRASCWQSKRIHASRLDQFSKGLAELRISVMQQIDSGSLSGIPTPPLSCFAPAAPSTPDPGTA